MKQILNKKYVRMSFFISVCFYCCVIRHIYIRPVHSKCTETILLWTNLSRFYGTADYATYCLRLSVKSSFRMEKTEDLTGRDRFHFGSPPLDSESGPVDAVNALTVDDSHRTPSAFEQGQQFSLPVETETGTRFLQISLDPNNKSTLTVSPTHSSVWEPAVVRSGTRWPQDVSGEPPVSREDTISSRSWARQRSNSFFWASPRDKEYSTFWSSSVRFCWTSRFSDAILWKKKIYNTAVVT